MTASWEDWEMLGKTVLERNIFLTPGEKWPKKKTYKIVWNKLKVLQVKENTHMLKNM